MLSGRIRYSKSSTTDPLFEFWMSSEGQRAIQNALSTLKLVLTKMSLTIQNDMTCFASELATHPVRPLSSESERAETIQSELLYAAYWSRNDSSATTASSTSLD